MQTALTNEMLERTEILADALGETIAELRLIDAGDMITYIRAGQWANISDLVQSSAELSFEDGAVSFAYDGDYVMSWGEAPSIALDMEFQTKALTAFFTLTIGPRESAVRIKDVMFLDRSNGPARGDARVCPGAAGSPPATRGNARGDEGHSIVKGPNDPPLRAVEIGRRVPVGASGRGDFTYSVVETLEPSQTTRSDRRREGRLRSRLREGQVAEGRGKVLVECRIRDLSKRGARLQLDKDRPLPKAFLLTEAGSRRSFWATLAWQVGRDAGVKLTPVD